MHSLAGRNLLAGNRQGQFSDYEVNRTTERLRQGQCWSCLICIISRYCGLRMKSRKDGLAAINEGN
jgi:hypothetical protein